jgi:DNA-binding PadR family transcriptional regulator
MNIFGTHKRGMLSGLEILVLKIIKHNPGIIGYDIIHKITQKPRGIWRGTAGSIYPILKTLAEKKKFVRIEEEFDGKRLKKKYFITEKGRVELKNVLRNNIYPSMQSFMDSIFTLIGDLPSVKRNVETMFCSFPHHRNVEIDEEDLSLENQEHIKQVIKRLELSRDELGQRLKIIKNQIERFRSILEDIEKERKEKSRHIEVYDDDLYT